MYRLENWSYKKNILKDINYRGSQHKDYLQAKSEHFFFVKDMLD